MGLSFGHETGVDRETEGEKNEQSNSRTHASQRRTKCAGIRQTLCLSRKKDRFASEYDLWTATRVDVKWAREEHLLSAFQAVSLPNPSSMR